MKKKLTKSDSMSKESSQICESKIINYKKPFKTKDQWVCIVHNRTSDLYEVRGVDCFGSFIRKSKKTHAEAEAEFYKELCWILNLNVMTETALQRAEPEDAYLNN